MWTPSKLILSLLLQPATFLQTDISTFIAFCHMVFLNSDTIDRNYRTWRQRTMIVPHKDETVFHFNTSAYNLQLTAKRLSSVAQLVESSLFNHHRCFLRAFSYSNLHKLKWLVALKSYLQKSLIYITKDLLFNFEVQSSQEFSCSNQ